MSNWKEQWWEVMGTKLDVHIPPSQSDIIQDFIETQIIEKLIEDIPDKLGELNHGEMDNWVYDGKEFKKRLKAKWLGKEHA
jgi:hypothetical protein